MIYNNLDQRPLTPCDEDRVALALLVREAIRGTRPRRRAQPRRIYAR